MRRFCLLTVMVACVLISATAPRAGEKEGDLRAVQFAITSYIQPGFARFANLAKDFPASIKGLCQSPGKDLFNKARSDFKTVLEAWAFIEFVRVGPLSVGNRTEKLFFWPDRRGIGLRQVERALLDKDPSVQSAAKLAGKSVALQGFGALEFLLFGSGSEALLSQEGQFRCGFAGAVADNVRSVANDLSEEWDDPEGFMKIWLSPSDDNPVFRTEKESLGEVLGTLTQALELIRDQRLAPIVMTGEAKVNPRRAIFWRSEMTFPVLNANIEGLSALSIASRFEDLLPEDERWLNGSAQFEFANAERTLAQLGVPMELAVQRPADQGRLNYLLILTNSLLRIYEGQIAPALNLPASFSLTDGD